MSKRVYRQIKNQAGEWELIEVGEPERGVPRLQLMGTKVRDNYRSPIDGTIIRSEREARYHMEKHGVVRTGDFGPNDGRDYFRRQQESRAAVFNGTSQELRKEIRQDVIETIAKLEQGQAPAKPRTEDV